MEQVIRWFFHHFCRVTQPLSQRSGSGPANQHTKAPGVHPGPRHPAGALFTRMPKRKVWSVTGSGDQALQEESGDGVI